MSLTPHPNTSSNGIQPPEVTPVSEPSQITIEGLQQHISSLTDEVNQMPQPVAPTNEYSGKLGDANYYKHYRALLAQAEVKLTDEIPEPVICLEIIGPDGSATLGTLGNFLLLIGKAKSRKTFLLSVLVAALVKVSVVMTKVRGHLAPNKRNILYFDTEQHKGHVKRVLKRIAILSEVDTLATIRVFHLKKFPPNERLNAIRVAIEDTPNLGLIIIDGVRDTVFDINDAKEATERATDILQWTEEKDAHLITVIHENKGNSNARGHLGSELVNKAETVISISRDPNDKEVSVVTPEYCRDREFEPFAFSIDQNALPYALDDWQADQRPAGRKVIKPEDPPKSSRSITPGQLTTDQHESILRRAFSGKEPAIYKETYLRIKLAAEYFGHSFGESKAKEFLTFYRDKQYFRISAAKYPMYALDPSRLGSNEPTSPDSIG